MFSSKVKLKILDANSSWKLIFDNESFEFQVKLNTAVFWSEIKCKKLLQKRCIPQSVKENSLCTVLYTRYNTPNKITVKMYAHQSCKITCKMKICQSMRLLRTDSIHFASRNGPTLVTKLKLYVTKRKNNKWKIMSKRDDIFTKQNF